MFIERKRKLNKIIALFAFSILLLVPSFGTPALAGLGGCIEITKTSDVSEVLPGESANYSFDVNNCGPVDLDCIMIDPFLPVLIPLGNIPSLGFINNIGPVPGPLLFDDFTNTASVTCEDQAGSIVSADSNPVTVTIIQPPVVGGQLLPIDSTALLLAGAQTFSWMIPVVLSVLGIGLFVFRKSE